MKIKFLTIQQDDGPEIYYIKLTSIIEALEANQNNLVGIPKILEELKELLPK